MIVYFPLIDCKLSGQIKSRLTLKMNNTKSEITFGIFSVYRDALMGGAILCIMLYHSLVGCDGLLRLRITGKIGVEFFLFLSGIGLYYSLKKKNNLQSFYNRRLIRILPEYLLLATPLYLAHMYSHNDSLLDFVANLTTFNFFFGDGLYFWYIHIILICYLIAPFYYRIVERTSIIYIVPIVVLLLSYIISYYYREYQMILPRYASFLLGMGVGKMAFQEKEIWGEKMMIVISPFIICLLYLSTFKGEILGVWMEPAYYFWIIIPLLLYMALIMEKSKQLCRIFTFLGSISLELYLLHEYFFLRVARYFLPGVFLPCIVSILLVIPFAWMLQKLNIRIVKLIKSLTNKNV